MIAALAERWVARGRRVVILVPRRELVGQTCDKLDAVGIEHGVIMSGEDVRGGLGARVQVASVDTLVARALKRKSLVLPTFDLAVMDEAHLSVTKIRVELLRELATNLVGAT